VAVKQKPPDWAAAFKTAILSAAKHRPRSFVSLEGLFSIINVPEFDRCKTCAQMWGLSK